MDRAEGIINEIESDYGVTLDATSNALCDGDTCRHSECVCWRNFERDCIAQAEQAAPKYFCTDCGAKFDIPLMVVDDVDQSQCPECDSYEINTWDAGEYAEMFADEREWRAAA